MFYKKKLWFNSSIGGGGGGLEGLIHYYNMNNQAEDGVGSIDGIETDVTYVPSLSDEAAKFNDSSSRIQLLPNPLEGLAEFSLSMIFKMTTNNSNNALCGAWHANPPNAYTILRVSSSQLQWFVMTDSLSQSGGSFIPFTDTTNWHHLVVTYDGATMKMYLDSVLSGTTFSQTGDMNTTLQDFTIGRERTNTGNHAIDGYGVWDVAIDQTMVTDIYNTQIGGSELV